VIFFFLLQHIKKSSIEIRLNFKTRAMHRLFFLNDRKEKIIIIGECINYKKTKSSKKQEKKKKKKKEFYKVSKKKKW
jgi:hypothetical protein